MRAGVPAPPAAPGTTPPRTSPTSRISPGMKVTAARVRGTGACRRRRRSGSRRRREPRDAGSAVGAAAAATTSGPAGYGTCRWRAAGRSSRASGTRCSRPAPEECDRSQFLVHRGLSLGAALPGAVESALRDGGDPAQVLAELRLQASPALRDALQRSAATREPRQRLSDTLDGALPASGSRSDGGER
jgi:hypothetical protein